MIYTSLCVSREVLDLGKWGEGLALEIESFVGPVKLHEPIILHVIYLPRSKTLRTGPYKSQVHK
jgi:hypothetical protein